MNTELKLSIVVVRSVALVFYTARVFTALWGWYLVPLGMKEVPYLNAVGIVLIGSLFTPSDYRRQWDTKEKKGFWLAVINRFVFVTVALVIGWFAQLFI